jgi:hypothetical protein
VLQAASKNAAAIIAKLDFREIIPISVFEAVKRGQAECAPEKAGSRIQG